MLLNYGIIISMIKHILQQVCLYRKISVLTKK